MIVTKPSLAIRPIVGWDEAYRAALATMGIDSKDKEPSFQWKVRSLMAEHSQCKLVQFCLSFKNLRQWCGIHYLRHMHTLPFIHSQRVDRRDLDEYVEKVMSILSDDIKHAPDFNKRDYLFQGEANDQDFYVNAQTLVNISRKRLCACASKETREAWQMVKDLMQEIDPAVAHCMVRQCVYRGFCPEMRPACKHDHSIQFKFELHDYRSVCKSQEDTAPLQEDDSSSTEKTSAK